MRRKWNNLNGPGLRQASTGLRVAKVKEDQWSTRAGRRVYVTAEWKKLSKELRSKHPYCAKCGRTSMQVQLQVDHIVPVRAGGAELDPLNLQVLCIPCHNTKTRKERDDRADQAWRGSIERSNDEP